MSSINKSLSDIKKQESTIIEIGAKLKYHVWDSSLPMQDKIELDEEAKSFLINITDAFDNLYTKVGHVGAN